MARSKKKSNAIKVDFTGVESSGSVAEGRQLLTVKEVELKTSESSGNDYLNWKFGAKGGAVYHSTSLQPQALWNLRNVLEALGMDVPESTLELDLTEFVGMECGAEIEHEKYQGKKKPVIVDLFPVEELDGEESEEESEEEEGEESEVTYDEVMEMDKDELLEVAKDNDIKVPAKLKRDVDKLRELVAEELGLEGEEEEEEEPSTTKSRKRGSKTLKEGAQVTFEDDGEEIEGKVVSINTKEGFAVIDVDGEEWEVELEDINV